MNILLLGGTGYLGGNIALKLKSEGHNVICAVRTTSDTSNLQKMGVNFITLDFCELELFMSQEKIEWIINAVCIYKTNDTLYDDMIEANTFLPLRVLNLAIKYGINNFMTMGTGLPETFNFYSFSKRKLSEFGEFLSKKNSINFVDLQLEMFYGGLGEPENRFLKACALKLIRNEGIDLTEGLQKRDIVRVEDVVNVIAKLINSKYAYGYLRLPVGSGEGHSIREIIEFMKNRIGSKSILNYGVILQREGREPDTCADISWLKDIGYDLKYTFYGGLEDYILNDF